jgi:hypothetical protein
MSRNVAMVLVLVALAAGFAVGYFRQTPREVAAAAAPAGGRVAYVLEQRCGGVRCQAVWAGADRDHGDELAALNPGSAVDEIVWLPDGTRFAVLVDGYQLRFYDAERRLPAGQINLIEPQGHPSSRLARGVTFSANGRAITFDDCPRARSGCRAGLAAVPQAGQ